MSRSFLKASLEHYCNPSPATLAGVAPSCVVSMCTLSVFRTGLSNLLRVADVDWFFIVDILPLPLFFDGCFVVVAARVDTLPPPSHRTPGS
jgi:hypothetical protein